jgi:hypothetical protein
VYRCVWVRVFVWYVPTVPAILVYFFCYHVIHVYSVWYG